MKVLSTEGLTKLIQLIKSTFIKTTDTVQATTVQLADVATTGDYDDLSNKPTIPTVNNGTLTIQENGTTVGVFTANQSENSTINIEISTFYGTCATGASTRAKVVVCPELTALKEGITIRVKFTSAQTYNGYPTLNVNGTGDIAVVLRGTTGGVRYMWQSGEVVEFTYDGTYWVWGRGGTATTTYYGITKLGTSATSTSTSVALTPLSLSSLVQDMIEPYDVYSASATYQVGDRVRYSSKAWECNTAIETAEAWTEAHWTALDPIQTQLDTKVSNTDYANSTTGGVIKPSSTTGTGVSGAGVLYASNSTYATYQDASNFFFISKGTLENVLTAKGYTSNVGTVTSVNNVQPDANGNVSLTIPDTSNLANKDLSNLSSTGNAKFQTPLVSGTNIKTVNGNSLLGSGNLTIQSAPDTDNKSITTNTSDELQTVGVIDSNNTTNAIKTWTGTKAQYDAIVTKDSNTLYNITDDTDITLPLLELLYPIGAIYIGTMSVCPLQVLGVGTWQLVASNRVLQGAGTNIVGTTVEAGLPNITGDVPGRQWGGGTGAFYETGNAAPAYYDNDNNGHTYGFDASRSNPIYGSSSTVQPPAYIVNIWERIS